MYMLHFALTYKAEIQILLIFCTKNTIVNDIAALVHSFQFSFPL